MKKRILCLLAGIILISLGTAICKETALGVDPFNAFCIAISEVISLSLGTTIIIVNSILLLIIFYTNTLYIGIGTLITMFSVGYFISFFNWLLPRNPFDLLSINNIFIFILGMIVMCFGIALYIESELGLVPYDCFSLILSEKFLGKYFIIRIIMDGIVSILAILLGGPISLGTIILSLGLGPLIDYFRRSIRAIM